MKKTNPTAKQMAKADLARGPMMLTSLTERSFWRAYEALVKEGFATRGPTGDRSGGAVWFTIVKKKA